MANTLDAPTTQLDATVKLFDSFYNFTMNVDASRYEIVRSYFYNVTSSNDSANNFATIIFRIAGITGEDPLTLLSYIQGKEKVEANAIMIYYLNSIKSKTALYGINIIPQSNQPVQRNVVI